jgi:hypothetical protein
MDSILDLCLVTWVVYTFLQQDRLYDGEPLSKRKNTLGENLKIDGDQNILKSTDKHTWNSTKITLKLWLSPEGSTTMTL